AKEHAPRAKTLGASGSNVVLPQDLGQVRAQESSIVRERSVRVARDRQEQVPGEVPGLSGKRQLVELGALEPINRQEVELHAEDEEQEDRDDVARERVEHVERGAEQALGELGVPARA